MDGQIASIISRVLASEQRAQEAEDRAKKAEERASKAEKEAHQFKCDAEVSQIQLGEAQQLASQAIGLCDEINRTGRHTRNEGWVCQNGERGRTLIPNQIHNLMVEILHIDSDDDRQTFHEGESDSEATAAPDEAEDTDAAQSGSEH